VLAGYWAHRDCDEMTFDKLVEIHEAVQIQRMMQAEISKLG
jgi:hypothetical protein